LKNSFVGKCFHEILLNSFGYYFSNIFYYKKNIGQAKLASDYAINWW